jgi:hypothetical protein
MTAATATRGGRGGRGSLTVTGVLAVAAVAIGWLLGIFVNAASTTVSAGALDFELPADWTVAEEADDRVVFTREGLSPDEAIVVYLEGSPEATGGSESFVELAANQFLLFTVDDLSENEAAFRYVQVDRTGGPTDVMEGRFVSLGGKAAAVFAPTARFEEVLPVFITVLESLRR